MSAPSFPALRPLQTLFWRLITAPEGVAAGAAALRREGVREAEDLSRWVRSDARLDATGRLDVYADMYFYRLRDCLAEDYPALVALVGAAPFHNLVTDYLLAHPSRHPSLRELGRALPDFVAGHALARRQPAAPDLARLEWARVDVFDDADAPPLEREALLAQGAAAPGSFAFRRVPASRLLRLSPAALAAWRAAQPGAAHTDSAEIPADPCQPPRPVLVWRRDFRVLHRSLPDDEAACLAALGAGPLTLSGVGDALARALHARTPPDVASLRFARLLEAWTRDALLCAPA